jgi:hypothetical protein
VDNNQDTFVDGAYVKSWEGHDSQVISEPGTGYYFFRVRKGEKRYCVQTPIARSHATTGVRP